MLYASKLLQHNDDHLAWYLEKMGCKDGHVRPRAQDFDLLSIEGCTFDGRQNSPAPANASRSSPLESDRAMSAPPAGAKNPSRFDGSDSTCTKKRHDLS